MINGGNTCLAPNEIILFQILVFRTEIDYNTLFKENGDISICFTYIQIVLTIF